MDYNTLEQIKRFLDNHNLSHLSKLGVKIYNSEKLKKIAKESYTATKARKVFRKMKKHPVDSVNNKCAQWNAYYKLLGMFKDKLDKINLLPEEKSNKIWIVWLQGLDDAPCIVKMCVDSIKENFGKTKEIIVIDENNLSQYVKLPEFIIEKYNKKLISHAHYSDIIRAALLSQHGGLYVDATVFCTGTKFFTDIIEKQSLFVYKEIDLVREEKGTPTVASNWLIYSNKNNPIIAKTLELLYYYWENNNKVIEYFIFHIIFRIVTDIYPEEWKSIPIYNNINPHILQFELLDNYSEERFDEIKKMSDFHKLNRRIEDYEQTSFCAHLINSHFPIANNKIVFQNWAGKGFGDNPKFIAEEIIRRKLNLDLVWLCDDLNEEMPKEIRKVKYGSNQAQYEMTTAKIWVDNVKSGMRVPKRKEQFYLQTWHGGCGAKKIEADAVLSLSYIKESQADSKKIDLIVSDCNRFTNIVKRCFWYDGKIIESGLPKYDIFINEDNSFKESIRMKMNIGKNDLVILYAPTFRSHSGDYYHINYKEIIQTFEKKYGRKVWFLIRIHNNNKLMKININKSIINVTDDIDGSKYSLISDVLITDYSSIFHEFLIRNKPVILYVSDYKKYIKERSLEDFFFDYPFYYAKTKKELLQCINSINEKELPKKYKEFIEKEKFVYSGQASKSLADIIIEKTKES